MTIKSREHFALRGLLLIILLLTACERVPMTSTPQMAQVGTVRPTQARGVSNEAEWTAEFTPPVNSAPRPTLEILSALQVNTVEADFVLVTPTEPPSKTPTGTPSRTITPTLSPTPTRPITATATFPQFPTSVATPVIAIVPQAIAQVCDSAWFFLNPQPAGCPLAAPTAAPGVYQTFQNGFMIWLGHQDLIYVFYNDAAQPRWETFRDEFDQGEPEDDPAYVNAPSPNTWQPRRGFGVLWRGNAAVRNRIGWATLQWEQAFSVTAQAAPDGTLFISEPGGGVFAASPGGQLWERHPALAAVPR